MNQHYRDARKIDPTRLPDGRLADNDAMEIGPTRLAMDEWAMAGLTLPDLPAMREMRWRRLTEHIVARGWSGLLMFDPLNIRYATDSTNMQLWNTHNPFRAVLLCADGYMVLWDYKNSPFLADHNPLVRESRSGASMFYFSAGDGIPEAADTFSGEVRDLVAEHGGGTMRLGVDKIMLHGAKALERLGFELMDGEECTERSRAIKNAEEIRAMRCAMHSCAVATRAMEDAAREGVPRGDMSEDDIWAVLHAENIRRGGEWIETRLLASGPRTNPWFQECGPRIVSENEIVAFDTDLIGPYGMCCDISRTWWIGEAAPRPDMIDAMRHAHEHIMVNMDKLRPGARMEDISRDTHVLRPEFQAGKYGTIIHGAGLCDEWPRIAYPDSMVPGAFDHEIEAGMVLCVEALVSPEGGDFSIKLEDQVLVTKDGVENLTTYPFDPRLMG